MAKANPTPSGFFNKIFRRSVNENTNQQRGADPPAYSQLFPEKKESILVQKGTQNQPSIKEIKQPLPKDYIQIDDVKIELPPQLNESKALWYKQTIEEAKEFTEKNKFQQTIWEFMKEHAKDSKEVFEVTSQKNGNLITVREKKGSKSHGIKFECYKSGNPKAVGKWVNNTKEGFRTFYFEDYSIQGIYKCKNDYIEGKYVQYNENQSLTKLDNYEKNLLHGTSLSFYPENEKVMIDTTYKNNQKQGPEIEYFENGSIKSITHWNNNKMEGAMYEFYPHQSIKHYSIYQNDLKEGEDYEFHENKTIKERCFYKKGLKEGQTYEFYEDKNIKESCFYKKGLKEGPQTFYRTDQTKEQVINWLNDKKHEETITYDSHGKEIKYELFWHGSPINTAYKKS